MRNMLILVFYILFLYGCAHNQSGSNGNIDKNAVDAFLAEENSKQVQPSASRSAGGSYRGEIAPQNYQQIVINKMSVVLFDPYSAQFSFNGEPVWGFYKNTPGIIPAIFGAEESTVEGWVGSFSVNAKNRFGAYTGAHQYTYLIRGSDADIREVLPY